MSMQFSQAIDLTSGPWSVVGIFDIGSSRPKKGRINRSACDGNRALGLLGVSRAGLSGPKGGVWNLGKSLSTLNSSGRRIH